MARVIGENQFRGGSLTFQRYEIFARIPQWTMVARRGEDVAWLIPLKQEVRWVADG